MLKMVETFSGIGAQAKALHNIKRDLGYDYEILNTADWDINAIIAYDLIHSKEKEILPQYANMTKDELINEISNYSLSIDGKKEASNFIANKLDIKVLRRLCTAIKRTKNLISVTDIKGADLPKEMNILTYSFPCQDLSVAGFWHGNKGGINREANNRSSMLWQIERILKERKEAKEPMPKFLLMENVRNIMSNEHKKNFEEWKNSLKELGYVNFVMPLNAQDYGIPQKRVRVYMISCLVEFNGIKNNKIEKQINDYQIEEKIRKSTRTTKNIEEFIKLDYRNKRYKEEAEFSNPNKTKSRIKIGQDNVSIFNGEKFMTNIIPTITTKQDRHPNSGVIKYKNNRSNKCDFRYLTPRECFLLMGFDEKDYDNIKDNDFMVRGYQDFFNGNKLIKMAGNSIVVNVLEEIFKLINQVNNDIYSKLEI